MHEEEEDEEEDEEEEGGTAGASFSALSAATSASASGARSLPPLETSGAAAAGLLEWSPSLHSLTQAPGASLPALPALWSAEDLEIGSVTSFSTPLLASWRGTRERPESTTEVTPGTVSEDSATGVERTILRFRVEQGGSLSLRGAKTLS